MKPGLRPDEIVPGAVVRLTGRFLRNTGQVAGGEGASRWTIVACGCTLCVPARSPLDASGQDRYVAVNEPHYCQTDPTGYEDIAPEDRPKWRHINVANLELDGKLVRLSNLPDAEPPIKQPLARRRRR